jgi:hypothetical protein
LSISLRAPIVEGEWSARQALEAAVGPFGDARRTVRRISQARAMHERITALEGLARLDAEHEARILTPTST